MTRCVETCIQFQEFIEKKLGVLIPIKIEYGLTQELCEQMYFWTDKMPNAKINLTPKGFEYEEGSAQFIDDYLLVKNIAKRYEKNKIDTHYKSIISVDAVNTEKTFEGAVNKRVKTFVNLFNGLDQKKK